MLSGTDRPWREPDGGNLHVRFDEGEGSGGHWPSGLSFRASLSTLLVPLSQFRREPFLRHFSLFNSAVPFVFKGFCGTGNQPVHAGMIFCLVTSDPWTLDFAPLRPPPA